MGLKRGIRLCAVIAAGLGLSLALSGCFVWSSFKWSSPVVKPGERATGTIGLMPENGGSRDRFVQFFLVGLSEQSQFSLGGARKWDVKGQYGGPETMFSDGSLANAATNSQSCAVGDSRPVDITGFDWFALRTNGEIDDRDKVNKLLISKLGLKAANGATPSQEQIYVLSGGWYDENDNQQPASDEIGCGGGTITAMTIK